MAEGSLSLELNPLEGYNLEEYDSEDIQRIDRACQQIIFEAYDAMKAKADATLHLSKEAYMRALNAPKKIKTAHWVITINEDAAWIENGVPGGFDMLPGLLNSPSAKTGKNGRYVIVPFHHAVKGTPPLTRGGMRTGTTRSAALTAQLKRAMREKGLKLREIEMEEDEETPKTGLLHKFDVQTTPQHSSPDESPTRKQQMSVKGHPLMSYAEGTPEGGRSFLQGVRIYQSQQPKKIGKGMKTTREVLTFRVAHEKHSGKQWIHPGTTGLNSLEEAQSYIEENWDRVMSEV